MKKLLTAVVAALACATVASAQTPPPAAPAVQIPASRCPAFPASPTLPDGAAARNSREMQAGDALYQEWARATQAVLECRRVEADELRIQAMTHEARVTEYNEAASRLNSVGQAWVAEATEYNARRNQR